MSTEEEITTGPAPATAEEARTAALAETVERLQRELDALMDEQEGEDAGRSLEGAVASFRELQRRNVSSVQLVALCPQ